MGCQSQQSTERSVCDALSWGNNVRTHDWLSWWRLQTTHWTPLRVHGQLNAHVLCYKLTQRTRFSNVLCPLRFTVHPSPKCGTINGVDYVYRVDRETLIDNLPTRSCLMMLAKKHNKKNACWWQTWQNLMMHAIVLMLSRIVWIVKLQLTTNLVDLDDVGQERQCLNLGCDEVDKHLSVKASTFPETNQQHRPACTLLSLMVDWALKIKYLSLSSLSRSLHHGRSPNCFFFFF